MTSANIQLAQYPRPTRRQTGDPEFEARRANRAQRRREAEQALRRRNHIAIAAMTILALAASSGWITEKVIWLMAMFFSFC